MLLSLCSCYLRSVQVSGVTALVSLRSRVAVLYEARKHCCYLVQIRHGLFGYPIRNRPGSMKDVEASVAFSGGSPGDSQESALFARTRFRYTFGDVERNGGGSTTDLIGHSSPTLRQTLRRSVCLDDEFHGTLVGDKTSVRERHGRK